MSAYDRFLDWFDRHKYGVIGTLMLHTLLLAVFSLSSVGDRYPQPPPQSMALDLELAMPEPEPEPAKPAEMQAGQEDPANQKVTNQASNTTAELSAEKPMSRAAQERMNERVDQDLHAMEQSEFARLAAERAAQGKDITVPTLDTTKFNKRNYMDKAPKPVKVEGLTTVSYDLKGRTDLVLEVPAYLCKGHGKVVIRVAVDRSGSMSKAEVDPMASTTTNDCMIENALASARGARFTSSSTAEQPQRGTITYIFLAQ
ncbi:MAG: hypothetical protein JST45_01215 [Bacteroidetes bacterium]|nr:hypothetical protein [Bacteroidota bacterium]